MDNITDSWSHCVTMAGVDMGNSVGWRPGFWTTAALSHKTEQNPFLTRQTNNRLPSLPEANSRTLKEEHCANSIPVDEGCHPTPPLTHPLHTCLPSPTPTHLLHRARASLPPLQQARFTVWNTHDAGPQPAAAFLLPTRFFIISLHFLLQSSVSAIPFLILSIRSNLSKGEEEGSQNISIWTFTLT